ncbi:MAG: Type II secretion system protein F [Chlamydiae bacterium]|nr:Type II secretion system protein F [Chlamydiota bacterium]
MVLYHYRYLDPKGRKKRAHLEANSLSEAKESLRAQNVFLLGLQEVERKAKKLFLTKKEGLVKENLTTFTTQLAQLLSAGIPLYESLLSLEEQYRSESFHPTLLTLCSQIKEGTSLSSAMSSFPDSFDSLYCSMVAAGESVGAVDQTLDKLATLLSKQSRLKKQLFTALLYPALLFAFSCGVILLMLTFVIPSLDALFENHHVNGFTKLVFGASRFITHYWLFYLPLFFGLVGGSVAALLSKQGKQKLQRFFLKVPLLKTVIIQTALARFSRTMGTLLEGGVSILQALQISRRVMRNPFLEKVVEEAESKIIEGSLLSIEFAKSSLFPSLVSRMLAIGEEGGSLAVMFQKLADIYEEEVEKILGRVTTLAQPVILIFMGGVIGVVMLAILLPLTDFNSFL